MNTYAIVENGVVNNVVIWDGQSDWAPPAQSEAIAVPAGESVSIGWGYSNGTFSARAVTAPSPTPAEQAEVALASGLTITSTGTPALNGTYACDSLSQADIIAIETSLNAGKGFPGGATSFGYGDASGVPHTFSEADFTNFAVAVRDFVYGCKAFAAGSGASLPSASVTIP